jgi:hypothetical protein
MRKIRIGIMTTLWKRHDLEKIVLSYYSTLEVEGVEIVGLAAGSEGDSSRNVAKEAGWYYVSARNKPLGAKHNKALHAISQLDRIDCVVIIGSDDLLNAKYFEYIRDRFNEGMEAVTLDGWYMHRLGTDTVTYKTGATTGAGRMLSMGLIRRRNFKAWPDGQNRMLDGSMHTPIMQYANPRIYVGKPHENGIVCIDIKSDTNMWSIAEMTDKLQHKPTKEEGAKAFFDKHFPGVLDKLNTIKQKENG